MRQLYKSQMKDPDGFVAQVEAFIKELDAFAFKIGEPRPAADPLVESVLKRIQVEGKPDKYVADYEIIDDVSPLPPHTLEEKKMELERKVLAAVGIARDKIIPRRKLRLWQITAAKLPWAKPVKERSSEEQKLFDFHDKLNEQFNRIAEQAANAEYEIEELTEANIDGWQIPTIG